MRGGRRDDGILLVVPQRPDRSGAVFVFAEKAVDSAGDALPLSCSQPDGVKLVDLFESDR